MRALPKFAKFAKMLKMHLPPHVVTQKMKMAGLSDADIDAFMNDKPLAVAAERSDPDGLVPSILRQGFAWLNEYGLEESGLWRIPGSRKRVDELKARATRASPRAPRGPRRPRQDFDPCGAEAFVQWRPSGTVKCWRPRPMPTGYTHRAV